MKKTFFALTLAILTASFARAQNITGDWQGTLKAGPAELRLVLHIAQNADGTYHATLDSIDQASYGLPVSSMSLKDSKLNFTVDVVHGTYEGKVQFGRDAATPISGNFYVRFGKKTGRWYIDDASF